MEGWVDLGYPAMHRPGVELAIFRSRVRRPNHYTTEPPNNTLSCCVSLTSIGLLPTSLFSGKYQIWRFQNQLDLVRFKNSNPAGARAGFGENLFWDHWTIQDRADQSPLETNTINNAVSCSKEAAQFSASFVTSLFGVFDEICGMEMNYVLHHLSNINYR